MGGRQYSSLEIYGKESEVISQRATHKSTCWKWDPTIALQIRQEHQLSYACMWAKLWGGRRSCCSCPRLMLLFYADNFTWDGFLVSVVWLSVIFLTNAWFQLLRLNSKAWICLFTRTRVLFLAISNSPKLHWKPCSRFVQSSLLNKNKIETETAHIERQQAVATAVQHEQET